MFGRRKIAALVAEFLGTGALTLLVLSVQRSTIGVPFFVAMAAGLTVALMVFIFGNASGAHLNPAVTLGMWAVRKVSTLNAVMYIAMQLLGAWVVYHLYIYYVNTPLQPIGGHFTGRILVAEGIGTMLFAMAWAAAIYQRFSTAVTASVVGLGYMLGIVAASSASIGLLNPALALGVRAWNINSSMGWGTYVLGPIAGAVIGFCAYSLLFTDEGLMSARATVNNRASASSADVKKPVAKRKLASKKKK